MTRLWSYGVRNRPIGLATVPKGYASIGTHPDFRHGTVSYAEPLSAHDTTAYELDYLPDSGEVDELVEYIASQYRDDADYADMLGEIADEPGLIEMSVGAEIERLGWHLQRRDVAKMVARALVQP